MKLYDTIGSYGNGLARMELCVGTVTVRCGTHKIGMIVDISAASRHASR
jgi:hypothetical protein